jgi:predicted enzyme related to lactoylglutathione lyase
MIDSRGRFVWYELTTPDIKAAKAFYAGVMGWETHDASVPGTGYTLFTVGKAAICGLTDLPEDARKLGVLPSWTGYVGVGDVDAAADHARQLGGTVLVPPIDVPNVSRLSVIADSQMATIALLKWREQQAPAVLNTRGRVGWHELFVDDCDQAFEFYHALFGWQKAHADANAAGRYQLFSTGGQTIGGMFTKPRTMPAPFWLYYFNVGADIDATVQRVKADGGQILEGPTEVPGGGRVARCADPQGVMFALTGIRSDKAIGYFKPAAPRRSSD